MRKNILKKISLLAVIGVMLFCGIFCFSQNQSVVYAVNSLVGVKIENDETVVSSELWSALYNFYKDTTGTAPTDEALTVDMFTSEDFQIVGIFNLSGCEIKSLTGLEYFDLSAFHTINLSNNELYAIGDEFKNYDNIKKIDLSNNLISNFSCEKLSSVCCSTNLTELNLSNNKITMCNLQTIANAKVNLSNNSIKTENLVWPESTLCSINLNNNYILQTNDLFSDVAYGFQGAKQDDKFVKSTEVLFIESEQLQTKTVEIYENDELVETLVSNEKVTLPVGNYRLDFINNLDEVVDSITFKIIWPKVTAKLFVKGEEIAFTSLITEDTVIKFYGEDGAEIFYSTNLNSEKVQSNEFTLSQVGTIVINVQQTKDGYSSETATFYFTVEKSLLLSWLYIFIGVVLLIVLYFVFMFLMNKVINGNSKTKDKGNLD